VTTNVAIKGFINEWFQLQTHCMGNTSIKLGGKMTKNRDLIDELETMLPKERVKRTKKEAEKEIFQIRLSPVKKRGKNLSSGY